MAFVIRLGLELGYQSGLMTDSKLKWALKLATMKVNQKVV